MSEMEEEPTTKKVKVAIEVNLNAVAAVHGPDGEPSPLFFSCVAATSTRRRAAKNDPVNSDALSAPMLLATTTARATG